MTRFDAFAVAALLGLLGALTYSLLFAPDSAWLVAFSVAGVLATWPFVRKHDFPWWVLVVGFLALAMALAGSLVRLSGRRLFFVDAFMVQYDHIVHFIAGAVLLIWVNELTDAHGFGSWRPIVLVPFVAGLTAMWEVVEFVAKVGFGAGHVGGYVNNMGDLIADIAGATVAAVFLWADGGFRSPSAGRNTA